MTISETLEVNTAHDYYELLAVLPTASSTDIKQAYHQSLLRNHPDKTSQIYANQSQTVDIGLLKQAFSILSFPELRARYDALRSQQPSGPRPALVVSLEEFTSLLQRDDQQTVIQAWGYDCRCGGSYKIDENQMNDEQHLIGCNGCSEVVWVGFEFANDDEEN